MRARKQVTVQKQMLPQILQKKKGVINEINEANNFDTEVAIDEPSNSPPSTSDKKRKREQKSDINTLHKKPRNEESKSVSTDMKKEFMKFLATNLEKENLTFNEYTSLLELVDNDNFTKSLLALFKTFTATNLIAQLRIFLAGWEKEKKSQHH